jgi:hypothetical protein
MTIATTAFGLLAGAALVTLTSATAVAQDAPPTRIRGDIVAVDASTLTVKRRGSGDMVKIALKPDVTVGAVKNVRLSDITKGSFIGTATEPGPDGKLTALEVVVFPEAARGTGEGHYAWDLMPGSMMTNANVDMVASGVKDRVLTLSYKGGGQQVTVPDTTPVVTFTPAMRSDLIVGKKVFIVASGSSASYLATRVVVEKDGVAPPM